MHRELLDVFLLLLLLLLLLPVIVEVVFVEAASDDGTTGPKLVVSSINAVWTWRLSRDNVGDVLDTLIVEI